MQKSKLSNPLKAFCFDTPLGPMRALADETALYSLDFSDYCNTNVAMEYATTPPIHSIINELQAYFNGRLMEFKTPLALQGSLFQKRVWEELRKIPFGETRSYADIARAIKNPTAYRAVAQANSVNPLTIVIPCHRVIYADGTMGGYSSGLMRKAWLLNYELQKTQPHRHQ